MTNKLWYPPNYPNLNWVEHNGRCIPVAPNTRVLYLHRNERENETFIDVPSFAAYVNSWKWCNLNSESDVVAYAILDNKHETIVPRDYGKLVKVYTEEEVKELLKVKDELITTLLQRVDSLETTINSIKYVIDK